MVGTVSQSGSHSMLTTSGLMVPEINSPCGTNGGQCAGGGGGIGVPLGPIATGGALTGLGVALAELAKNLTPLGLLGLGGAGTAQPPEDDDDEYGAGGGGREPEDRFSDSGDTSSILNRTPKQLQKKFKHAKDFGVEGNYNTKNAAKFSEAIHKHINSPGTIKIEGTYNKDPVTHYLDPKTGLDVMADPNNNFISGWKLNDAQLKNVLERGSLGGR